MSVVGDTTKAAVERITLSESEEQPAPSGELKASTFPTHNSGSLGDFHGTVEKYQRTQAEMQGATDGSGAGWADLATLVQEAPTMVAAMAQLRTSKFLADQLPENRAVRLAGYNVESRPRRGASAGEFLRRQEFLVVREKTGLKFMLRTTENRFTGLREVTPKHENWWDPLILRDLWSTKLPEDRLDREYAFTPKQIAAGVTSLQQDAARGELGANDILDSFFDPSYPRAL